MNIKKIITLVVAVGVMSPMAAIAENQPDHVGDVTLLGNIVANSPMWQWTVNDYPGPRLDTKPSEAITTDGKMTYLLTGLPFIAVSGYLPSLVAVSAGAPSYVGLQDKTVLADGNGNPITSVADLGKGKVSFDIVATSQNVNGKEVVGTLSLESTELRGYRVAESAVGSGSTPVKELKALSIFGSMLAQFSVPGGSCFSGVGSYSTFNAAASGTSESPVPGEQSATAFTAFVDALRAADVSGAAPSFETLTGYAKDSVVVNGLDCDYATLLRVDAGSQTKLSDYMAAAHIMELTPVSLTFPEQVSGQWSATLTVTAYQM